MTRRSRIKVRPPRGPSTDLIVKTFAWFGFVCVAYGVIYVLAVVLRPAP